MSRTITHVSVASKSHKLKTYWKHNHGAFHYFLSDNWLAPSKLLANQLEAKLPENILWPRRLVGVPLLPEVSRSLTGIALELLRYAKSAATRIAQTFSSARCHSNVLPVKSYRLLNQPGFRRQTWNVLGLRRCWLCRSLWRLLALDFFRMQTCVQSTRGGLQSCQKTCNLYYE